MAGLSRRDLLRSGAGLALGATGLAGCQLNSGVQANAGDTRKPFKKQIDGDLAYFNWAEYINPDIIKGFEKKYGVKVRESNFDSMPAMMAKLRAGIEYDLIFPTAEFAQRLIRGNQLRVFDGNSLHAADLVFDQFHEPWYDKNAAHTIPYTMYATGIGYRADRVGELSGSWRDLVSDRAEGRIFMLDDFQEGIGMGNLVNGYSLNTVDPEELDRSKDYLIEIKPKLRGYSSDTLTNMASGNAWIQHLWNGDIVNIRNQVKNPEDFKFQKCREGIPVGSDTFAIPVNAKHPGTALMFIEYVLRPENAASNVEWVGYPMPYKEDAEKAFAGLVKDDPAIAVTVDDLDNGQQFENLEGEGRKAWDRTWTEVKVA
ncbi:MAG: spermidine/putrescine transport system substrate-binding protein [Thermoleophilaceae bacterium]|nr:spermidine/putrescine transport system substrate-binding protein [Thermoleophilaceae bacterium]